MSRFIEHVAHHLRKLDHGALGVFGVDVYQGVDVVERVHEEMGVYLVFQIVHFCFQVLAFEFLHLLFVAHRLVDELDTRVGPRHEEPQHDVPVHFQVRERSFPVGVERFGVAVGEEAVGEVFFVYVHQPEYGDDECKVAEQVCFVLAAQHEPRGEDGIMDDEDDEIGGYLPPCDEYVFETDVQFRHHLRIEHRHQDDGCPHHYVEQVFSDGLFAGHFHAVKIIKKSYPVLPGNFRKKSR